MKAKDFIREFGWKEAKLFVDENISAGDVYDNIDDNYVYVETNWTELKQYIDAYELVQLHGSLRLANHYAMKNHCLSDSHTADDLWTVIALVEEVGDCNE